MRQPIGTRRCPTFTPLAHVLASLQKKQREGCDDELRLGWSPHQDDGRGQADPALAGDNLKNLPLMASEDLATNIAATRAFVHGCFSKQPTADDFETMLSFNMMVPPKVRAGLSGRPLDATEIMSKLKLPVLVTHGAEDRNAKLGAAKYTTSVIPGARLSIYEGTGHAPFYEDVTRFNTELAAFVREANKTN